MSPFVGIHIYLRKELQDAKQGRIYIRSHREMQTREFAKNRTATRAG